MKLLKVFLAMVAMVCVIGLVACTDDDDPVAGETGSTGSTPGPPGTPDDLVGYWVSDCHLEDNGLYEIKEITCTSTECTKNNDHYSDAGCSFLLYEADHSREYITGSAIVNSKGETVWEIDETVISSGQTIRDTDFADAFNDNEVCGYTDWVVDVPKDTAGNTDCFWNPQPVGDVNRRVFQLPDSKTLIISEDGGGPGEDRQTELCDWSLTKQ